jgi:phosphoribosyl 1,2-cyclic phosphate phosphodiesterase
MQILFMGTGAGEGIPAPFCQCPVCVHAREAGGRDVRMRTATLVNNDLLLDCGPDLVAGTQRFGVSLNSLETLLITHAHSDHFLASNLILRLPVFRADTPVKPLRIFGPPSVMGRLRRTSRWPVLRERAALSFEAVRAGQSWQSGQYHVAALSANHDPGHTALLYTIRDGTRRLFYATDSGPLSERAWQVMAREGPFDAVLINETMGQGPNVGLHNNMHSFLQARQRFVDQRLLKKGALFVAFHFSHDGDLSHEELVHCLEPRGVTVAYDGMKLVL